MWPAEASGVDTSFRVELGFRQGAAQLLLFFFVVHRVIGSISLMISQIDHGMVGSICLQCNHCSHCNHVPRSLGRRRKMKPVPIRKINGRRLWKRNWRMPAGPAFGVILPGWYRFEVIETKFGDKRIQIHMIHTGVCLYIYKIVYRFSICLSIYWKFICEVAGKMNPLET